MHCNYKQTLSFFFAVSVCTSLATSAIAQTAPAATSPEAVAGQTAAFSPGIAVGQKVPAIQLKDQTGSELALAAVLEKSPVALVLFRSANW